MGSTWEWHQGVSLHPFLLRDSCVALLKCVKTIGYTDYGLSTTCYGSVSPVCSENARWHGVAVRRANGHGISTQNSMPGKQSLSEVSKRVFRSSFLHYCTIVRAKLGDPGGGEMDSGEDRAKDCYGTGTSISRHRLYGRSSTISELHYRGRIQINRTTRMHGLLRNQVVVLRVTLFWVPFIAIFLNHPSTHHYTSKSFSECVPPPPDPPIV